MINAPVRQIRARQILNKLRKEQGREELQGHKSFEQVDYDAAKGPFACRCTSTTTWVTVRTLMRWLVWSTWL